MKFTRFISLCCVFGLAAFLVLSTTISKVWPADASLSAERDRYQKLYDDGNYKDAYDGFRKLTLDATDDPLRVGSDLDMALNCLRQLGRLDEIDELRENAVQVHAQNWRLLEAAADSYLNFDHFGFIVAGKFSRGPHRGGGEAVNSMERDRVRAMQMMAQAIPLVQNEPKKVEAANFWMAMSRMLLANRGYNDAWRLQYLTNLNELSDYEQGWYRGSGTQGAPVDADGNPVYHYLPKSWQAAQSDGERWRWALSQAAENNPRLLNAVREELANFLQNQFGVQTMAFYGAFFGGLEDDETKKDESGTWALHTLADSETIARLASGIKRFKLPDEFNFIRIYQQIADEPKTGHGEFALEQLAHIYENRRQYPQAAEYWRRSIKEYGPGHDDFKKQRLEQIVGNWARFEPVVMQPAGKGATVDFRFRNGKKVTFEAREIKVAKLLNDVKQYLKSNPNQLDWQRLNIADVGYRLVQEKQDQYVGERVAQWDLDLKPRPQHFDSRMTVSTPLQKAGAYLLTAKMADGNTSQIVIWLEDTAIVKKPLSKAMYYYLGDAVSGAPIPKANIEFFGYRQRQVGNNKFFIDVQDYAEHTDGDGQLVVNSKEHDNEFQWIVTATTPEGRLAYLGFTNVWSGDYYDSQYNETKVYTITDRPVYRPNQKVQFKFWVCHAQYDQEDKSEFANQTFGVEIQNPKGRRFSTKRTRPTLMAALKGS